MKNSFKIAILFALTGCFSSGFGSSTPNSPVNTPALKSNSTLIAGYEVGVSSINEVNKAAPSFVLSGNGEMTATVGVKGILDVNVTPTTTEITSDGDIVLGTIALNITYNGVNETSNGRPYVGKTFKMYAYSEGLVGKIRDSNIAGIKLQTSTPTADTNAAAISLNNSMTLSNSRNLASSEPYNGTNPAVLVASWNVTPSSVQYIKNTINMNVTASFGSTTSPLSAQGYLGNIGFYFVAEDTSSLTNGDILQNQIDSISSNSKIYTANITNPTSLPYSVKIVGDTAGGLSNQVKITVKATSTSTGSDITGKLKSGIITAIYNNKKIFIKKIKNDTISTIRIINGENESEYIDYQ